MTKLKNKNQLFLTHIFIILFITSIFWMNIAQANIFRFNEIQTLDENSGEILSVKWSPDGKQFVTGSSDGKIVIYDSYTLKEKLTINGHDNYRIKTVTWNPNGTILASGACDNTIKLWNAKNGILIKTLIPHTECVNSISWSPDGKQFAAGYSNNNTQIWDTENGTIIKTLTGDKYTIWSVNWSPDGRMLSIGAERIQIWNTTNWKNIITLPENESYFLAEWSPNGRMLASENNRYEITIWDTKNWTEINNLTEQPTLMNSISWSPDSLMFVSGSRDNTSIIWDPKNIIPLKIFTGHSGEVTSVDWSPDGKRIISGSADKTVIIWSDPFPIVHIISLISDKSNIIGGDTVNITATILNEGSGDSNNTTLHFYDGFQLLKEMEINITHGTTLNITYIWATNLKTVLGAHIFRAVLENEEKNITIKVNGIPNVIIRDLRVDKKEIVAGKTNTFYAIVENNGTADAYNVSILFIERNTSIEKKQISILKGTESTVTFSWNTTKKQAGVYKIKVVVGSTFKETIVTILPRVKTSIESNQFCIELIIFLIIVILMIIVYNLKQCQKEER